MLELERYQFLAELDDALRSLVEPEDITYTAATILGRYLGVNRCAYAHVNGERNTFVVTGSYANGVPGIKGEYENAAFGEEFVRLSHLGIPYLLEDAEVDERVNDVRNAYRLTSIRAVISVPVIKAGKFVAGMAVHQTTPRQWQENEVQLLEVVANRCWESIERNRIAIELRKAEERIRSDRDYLRLLIDCAEEGFYSIDRHGAAIMCNTAFLKLLGFENENEVNGKKCTVSFITLILLAHLIQNKIAQSIQSQNAASLLPSAYFRNRPEADIPNGGKATCKKPKPCFLVRAISGIHFWSY